MRTPTRISRALSASLGASLGVPAVAAALFLGAPVATASAAPAVGTVTASSIPHTGQTTPWSVDPPRHEQARAGVSSPAAVGDICLSSLPDEAFDTLDLIDRGGPFPYPQDGDVFQNREGILPSEPTGYYHEYTVETPGSPDRGARRIVTGRAVEEDYYTSDHYASFDLIDFDC